MCLCTRGTRVPVQCTRGPVHVAHVTLYTCPPELHRQGILGEDLRRVSQRPARLVLALRRDNLGSGYTGY